MHILLRPSLVLLPTGAVDLHGGAGVAEVPGGGSARPTWFASSCNPRVTEQADAVAAECSIRAELERPGQGLLGSVVCLQDVPADAAAVAHLMAVALRPFAHRGKVRSRL